MSRIQRHPILSPKPPTSFSFSFDGHPVQSLPGETIAAALFAAGIHVFGHHPKDGSPQGLFCANGQCSQCLVIADGVPVKACMTPAKPDLCVESMTGLPTLPVGEAGRGSEIPEIVNTDVLILGGGPAGLSAALELAQTRVTVLLVDDKDRLGGKLVLQTHRFFGSTETVYAGTRGMEIGERLSRQVSEQPHVSVWLNSTALAVYGDRVVGILHGSEYIRVRPRVLLVATGARERSLAFQGNTLPGVYGAGAFQTLLNRDLVRPSKRLFIVGGGNVGLIAGYHALQAEIDVVGLVEALPACGGYKVHRDKLARLGVPIHTSHTILSANGAAAVESVTVARVNEAFQVVPGTERTYACDTVLIAVGLDPVDEFTCAAERFGLPVHTAGDAEEIAEASAAIFAGRIAGRQIAIELGTSTETVPISWHHTADILKSRPGPTGERTPSMLQADAVFPVFHCTQQIPCNPCATVCPQGLIHIDPDDIRHLPQLVQEDKLCIGCMKCVSICPGLAVTLVDTRLDPRRPMVTVPLEFDAERVPPGSTVVATDVEGQPLGEYRVLRVLDLPRNDRTALVQIEASPETAVQIAGLQLQPPWVGREAPTDSQPLHNTDIICRCERVTAGEIRRLIEDGHRDINEIKTLTRAGMGSCGGKTCQALIFRLFRECGVRRSDIVEGVPRPLFVEVPLGVFAGATAQEREERR